jgi:hypothetical protein
MTPGGPCRIAAVRHFDERAVCGLEDKPHVERRAAVLAHRLPVVAAFQYLAGQRLAVERAARQHSDAAIDAGRSAHDLQRAHIEAHYEQRPRSDLPKRVGEVATETGSHGSYPFDVIGIGAKEGQSRPNRNERLEKPRTSTFVSSRTLMKATAALISSNEVGTSPELLETPGVVEQDLRDPWQAVRHRRVPMVHRASEVLVEDEGYAARFAEASVSEPNTSRRHELRRRGLATVLGH